MAGKWDGFTEEDIKFFLDKNEDHPATNGDVPKPKTASFKSTAIRKPSLKDKHLGLPTRNLPAQPSNLPESALLLKPNVEKESEKALNTAPNVPLEPKVLVTTSVVRPVTKVEEESETKAEDPVKVLELFQTRQKLLEEQNRQRKQFLTKLLTDRRKQTTEEARRLQKIQEELQKLDILLSNDVGILRDEIEVASMEFGEAQKRFNRAEKEFLEAKQQLFGKLERKELLTKHLCTIIEENEIRKAQKLSELMSQLRVDPSTIETNTKTETVEETKPTDSPVSKPDIVADSGVS